MTEDERLYERKRRKLYYRENRDRLLAKQRESRAAHRDEWRDYYARYYAEHREELNRRRRERYRAKKEEGNGI